MTTRLPIRNAAVVGTGMSNFRTRRDDVDLIELMIEPVELALEDAGLEMGDIDAVVLGMAPDPLHGVGHPEQTAASAYGLKGRPLTRIHTGGATGISAAQAGWWQIVSGRYEKVLVVAVERMGDNTSGAQRVLNEIWDPAYEALMPLNTIANCSLMAVRYMERFGATEEDFAHIASRLRANGARNSHAHLRQHITPEEIMKTPLLTWPIRMGMSCPRSTGGAAMVMTSADVADRLSGTPAWIKALSGRTDTYFMGDRMRTRDDDDEYIAMDNLAAAAAEAYAMAGITDPVAQIDVAEPYVPFAPYESMMLEAMHLAPAGTAFTKAREGFWDVDGEVAVCPSGGVMCSNPISATALVRMVEAVQQVRGLAGDHQVEGARTAVATGAGGDSQFYGVAVVSRDDPRV